MDEPQRGADAIRSITWRYYVVWAWYTLPPFLIFAVFPLFLRARGLDQLRINSVTAVYVLMTFLTDVPTGAFADAVGRRAAVVVGCALHAAAFLMFFVSHRFWQFIVAEVLDGLGTTFGNGPIDAWAIDALDRAGFEGPKDALFSRKFQLGQIVGMCGSLAGAYIAQINIAAPFLLNTIVWSVTALVALALMGRSTGPRRSINRIFEEVGRRSIDSTKLGFADRYVRWMSVAGLLGAFLWYGWGQEWQHYFYRGLHSGIGSVGWVSVAIILAQVAGLELAARLRTAPAHRAAFLATITGAAKAAIIIAGLAGARMPLALGAVMVATLLEGVGGPIGFAWYNEVIAGENRATLLSFGTTMSTLGGIIGLTVQGRLVDMLGTGVTWQIAGLVSMTNVLCYVTLGRRAAAHEPLESK